jgi:hypothetical protein
VTEVVQFRVGLGLNMPLAMQFISIFLPCVNHTARRMQKNKPGSTSSIRTKSWKMVIGHNRPLGHKL